MWFECYVIESAAVCLNKQHVQLKGNSWNLKKCNNYRQLSTSDVYTDRAALSATSGAEN